LAVLFLLNADMYTEFFLSGRVSKIQRNLNGKIVLNVLMKQAETLL